MLKGWPEAGQSETERGVGDDLLDWNGVADDMLGCVWLEVVAEAGLTPAGVVAARAGLGWAGLGWSGVPVAGAKLGRE